MLSSEFKISADETPVTFETRTASSESFAICFSKISCFIFQSSLHGGFSFEAVKCHKPKPQQLAGILEHKHQQEQHGHNHELLNMNNGNNPVSYTHLDVYKRQACVVTLSKWFKIRPISENNTRINCARRGTSIPVNFSIARQKACS